MSRSSQYSMNLPFCLPLASLSLPFPPPAPDFFLPHLFLKLCSRLYWSPLFTSLPGAPLPLPALPRLALGEQSPVIEVHSMLSWKTGLLFRKSLITSPPPGKRWRRNLWSTVSYQPPPKCCELINLNTIWLHEGDSDFSSRILFWIWKILGHIQVIVCFCLIVGVYYHLNFHGDVIRFN